MPPPLFAQPDCPRCYGEGVVWENHGEGLLERLSCDCVTNNPLLAERFSLNEIPETIETREDDEGEV